MSKIEIGRKCEFCGRMLPEAKTQICSLPVVVTHTPTGYRTVEFRKYSICRECLRDSTNLREKDTDSVKWVVK